MTFAIPGPDNETVAHLVVDLGSRDTMNIMSLPAVSIPDLDQKLSGPQQVGRH